MAFCLQYCVVVVIKLSSMWQLAKSKTKNLSYICIIEKLEIILEQLIKEKIIFISYIYSGQPQIQVDVEVPSSAIFSTKFPFSDYFMIQEVCWSSSHPICSRQQKKKIQSVCGQLKSSETTSKDTFSQSDINSNRKK